MATQTCKFFNQKGGCRNGDKCPYSHVSRRPKKPQMCPHFARGKVCPMFENGGKHANFGLCTLRHHATKREKSKIEYYRRYEAVAYHDRIIAKAEEVRFAIICGFNKHWRNEVLTIRETLRHALSDSLLQLIGSYHVNETNPTPVTNLVKVADWYNAVSFSGTVSRKCDHCDRKCNDLWVVISPKIVSRASFVHF